MTKHTHRGLTIVLGVACFAWMSGVLGRLSYGEGVSIHVLDGAVGLLALYMLRKQRRVPERIDALGKRTLMWVGIASVSLVLALLHFPAPEVARGGMYLVRWMAYASLLWFFPLFPHMRSSFVKLFTVAASGTLLLAYAQYVLYPDLRNLYWAGWDEHVYRMFGTQLDPNFMGGVLVVCGIWFAMRLRHVVQVQNTNNAYSKLLYLFYGCSIVLSGVGVLLTYSRGAYIMAAATSITLLIVYRAKRMALGLALLGALIAPFLLSQNASEGVRLLRTASIQARVQEYREAVDIASRQPILGHGYNMYRYAAQREGFIHADTWKSDHAGAGVPNSYLFILATTGLFGLLAYLRFLAQVYRLINHDKLVTALLIGLSLHALTENSLVYPYIFFPVSLLVAYVRSDYADDGSL